MQILDATVGSDQVHDDGFLKDLDGIEDIDPMTSKSKDRTKDMKHFFDNPRVSEGRKMVDCILCR